MRWSRKRFLSGLAARGAGMSLLPSAPRRAFATDAPARTAEVTAETAAFVAATRYEDPPPELIALGKQHILDAFDLAIVGEKAESGPTVRRYLADLGRLNGPPTVLGTNLQAAPASPPSPTASPSKPTISTTTAAKHACFAVCVGSRA
jgi:hypothetical protein